MPKRRKLATLATAAMGLLLTLALAACGGNATTEGTQTDTVETAPTEEEIEELVSADLAFSLAEPQSVFRPGQTHAITITASADGNSPTLPITLKSPEAALRAATGADFAVEEPIVPAHVGNVTWEVDGTDVVVTSMGPLDTITIQWAVTCPEGCPEGDFEADYDVTDGESLPLQLTVTTSEDVQVEKG